MMARRDANHRMCELLEEDRVPLNIDITRSGEEYYEWGNATCMSLWRNAQARSPWENAWI
jgi:hypothetical protein